MPTTALLNDALDDSFRRDPGLGIVDTDHMFAASAFYRAPPKREGAGQGRQRLGKSSARKAARKKK